MSFSASSCHSRSRATRGSIRSLGTLCFAPNQYLRGSPCSRIKYRPPRTLPLLLFFFFLFLSLLGLLGGLPQLHYYQEKADFSFFQPNLKSRPGRRVGGRAGPCLSVSVLISRLSVQNGKAGRRTMTREKRKSVGCRRHKKIQRNFVDIVN